MSNKQDFLCLFGSAMKLHRKKKHIEDHTNENMRHHRDLPGINYHTL